MTRSMIRCAVWQWLVVAAMVAVSAPAMIAQELDDGPKIPETIGEKASKAARRLGRRLTGKEADDLARARSLYLEANALFESATAKTDADRKETFLAAAKVFGRSADAAEGKALEQDSLFMRGESFFFADHLSEATEAYQKLQTEHPRNRHSDMAAARLFSISRYWIDAAKVDADRWIAFNWSDRSRPRLDPDGHAIRVLDQIRYDDPTGRLADDATMAAAAEYIRQEKFDEADEFLTDLRETFPDSSHLFLAHMLGIQCKLEIYRGPQYSGLVLDEAAEIIEQTRRRFPDKLQDESKAEMIARASSTVAYHRAERYLYRADYREKKREFGAARDIYQQLIDEHGDTPQATIARKRLQEISPLPADPEQRLGWLTKIFPDSRSQDPLVLQQDAAASETIRR